MSDVLEAVMIVLGSTVLAILLIMVFAIIGTAIAALTGWVLSLTYLGDMILSFTRSLGYEVNLVEFGAFMGFISGFLISKSNYSNKDD